MEYMQFLMVRLSAYRYLCALSIKTQHFLILIKYFCMQTLSNNLKFLFFILTVVKCLFKDHGNRKRSNVFKIV